MTDEAFLQTTTARLAALPSVRAVTLGGSRAEDAGRPDSDWDFAIYYEGAFDPADLRAVGWPGHVSEIGEWGPVFCGGAWLEVQGRRADIHYRDLAEVRRRMAEADAGRFTIEPLMFHLAGIPTYLLVAELALGRVLSGELPRPDYPPALQAAAPARWFDRARQTLHYALEGHAAAGRLTECAGLLAQAAAQSAHAVLAARAQWVTNDKRLLARAGLRDLDDLIGGLDPEPARLQAAAASVGDRCAATVRDACAQAGVQLSSG